MSRVDWDLLWTKSFRQQKVFYMWHATHCTYVFFFLCSSQRDLKCRFAELSYGDKRKIKSICLLVNLLVLSSDFLKKIEYRFLFNKRPQEATLIYWYISYFLSSLILMTASLRRQHLCFKGGQNRNHVWIKIEEQVNKSDWDCSNIIFKRKICIYLARRTKFSQCY